MDVKTAGRLTRHLSSYFKTRTISSSSRTGRGELENAKPEVALPPEPSHCCMSGCANCVWIKYAQELAEKFDNGDVIARQKISENVKDPILKAYLLTTLGLQGNDVKSKPT